MGAFRQCRRDAPERAERRIREAREEAEETAGKEAGRKGMIAGCWVSWKLSAGYPEGATLPASLLVLLWKAPCESQVSAKFRPFSDV